MARHIGGKHTAGGLSKKEYFYQIFNGARCRCTDPSKKHDYPKYGGRGIKCEWDNYLDFKRDMYDSYLEHKKNNKSTTLERIDNNGNYSKENCRWATIQEQAKNRRTNKYITFKGRTMIVADWARELKVSRQTIGYRLRNGWDIDSIIKTPFSHANIYNKVSKSVSSSKGIHRKKSP